MANTVRVEGNFENCPSDRLAIILKKYSDYTGTLQICEHVQGTGVISHYNKDIPLVIFHSEGDSKYIDVNQLGQYGTVLHCNYKWSSGKYFNYWAYDYLKKINDYNIELNNKNNFLPKFLCLNSRPDWHRYWTIQHLVNENLFKFGYVSFLNRYNQLDSEYYFTKFLEKYKGDTRFVSDLFKNKNLIILDKSNEQISKNDRTHSPYIYQGTSVSLVTETYSEVKRGLFITEKSWKPIANCHFQIWIAQPGIVQAFRDFGFDMFDDIIDNSYDEISKDVKRFKTAIRSLKNFLVDIKNFDENKKKNLQQRLLNNKQKYLDMRISEFEIQEWLT